MKFLYWRKLFHWIKVQWVWRTKGVWLPMSEPMNTLYIMGEFPPVIKWYQFWK